MKVLCFPADAGGCGSYRIGWPAQYLAHLGHDVQIVDFGVRDNEFSVIADSDGNLKSVKVPEGVDVVVFQRISRRVYAEALLLLREKGIAVIHDMDDDLGRIHTKNFAFSNYEDPDGHSYKWCELACKNATLVTTSTPRLAEIYGFGHGRVINNYVPGSYLDLPRRDSDILGWAGSTSAHPEDLTTVGRSVRRLVDEGSRFIVVGPQSNVRDQLHLKKEPVYTGSVNIMDWGKGVGLIGVGMAPLQDSLFNESKSRLKLAEMSACGVPWVASPTREYKTFAAESGTGILASSPNEWHRALKQLVENPDLRAEMSEAGREYMKTQTIENNAWRWWQAWTEALEMERGSSQS